MTHADTCLSVPKAGRAKMSERAGRRSGLAKGLLSAGSWY